MSALLTSSELIYGRNQQALGGPLNLELKPGQITAVLGANGSGKTTLLLTLLGILPPISGQVFIQQQPIANLQLSQRAQQIAYVPQSVASHPGFSVLELVVMGRCSHLGLFSQPAPSDYELANQALESLGIGQLAQHTYSQLSGGQQQLVLIARALTQQANILILDEPTSSLDFANQVLVLEHLEQLSQQGFAIIFSTHQPQHAIETANQLVLMRHQQQPKLCSAQELSRPELLAEFYGISRQQLTKYLGSY